MAVWLTCSEIAERWDGITAGRVARVVALIGIGDSAVHSRSRHGSLLRGIPGVPEFSPAACGLIERELQSRGSKRAEAKP